MTTRKEEFDQGKVTTTSGRTPENFERGAPEPIDPSTGQHKSYWVLSESERAKGFVRPVRSSYKHVGILGPLHPLRDLTHEEEMRFRTEKYVKYERYPETEESSIVGRYWTQEQLDKVGKGCGTVTHMGRALAETYARDPRFYGATMCVNCGAHYAVSEFVWIGEGGEIAERLGT